MSSREISDLTEECRNKYLLFDRKMTDLGIPFKITCTARYVKEQVAYYAQGRQPLLEVNRLRKMARLLPISAQENKRKITWTLNSKHIVDLDDGNIGNDKSRAFDIVICKNGEPNWNTKVDVNLNNESDYIEAGEIGESVGLKWGGRFKSPDMPHFEV